jgi:hypothetical protein
MERLRSLVDGPSAIERLAACGPRAIPPLREFLLSGRVTSVPQPRMWAVETRARLEATGGAGDQDGSDFQIHNAYGIRPPQFFWALTARTIHVTEWDVLTVRPRSSGGGVPASRARFSAAGRGASMASAESP